MTNTTHRRMLLSLAAFTFCTAAAFLQKENSVFSPENTVIVFDLDNVLILKEFLYKMKIALNDPQMSWAIWQSRTTKNNKTDIYDDSGNQVHGLTFETLYVGSKHKNICQNIVPFLKSIENIRYLDQNIIKLIKHLKSQGYAIVFATNKDRSSYDRSAQHFGTALTDLADKVFVAHPGNNETFLKKLKTFIENNKNTLPQSYVKLAEKTLEAQPTNIIYHAPTHKPNASYYNYVFDTVGRDKNVVFIDDNKENIQNFNKLNTDKCTRIGIHYKNPKQLTFDFYTLGLLNGKPTTCNN